MCAFKTNQLTGGKQNHVGPTGSELPLGPEVIRSLKKNKEFLSKLYIKVKNGISSYYELQVNV